MFVVVQLWLHFWVSGSVHLWININTITEWIVILQSTEEQQGGWKRDILYTEGIWVLFNFLHVCVIKDEPGFEAHLGPRLSIALCRIFSSSLIWPRMFWILAGSSRISTEQVYGSYLMENGFWMLEEYCLETRNQQRD